MQVTARGDHGRRGSAHFPMPADQSHLNGVEGSGEFRCASARGGVALEWLHRSNPAGTAVGQQSVEATRESGLRVVPATTTGPVQFISRLISSWRLSTGDAVRLLGFNQEDLGYVEDILAGVRQPRGRDVHDRIAFLFRIRAILSALFRDLDVENQWLREPHEFLDDCSPMELMQGSIERLLLAREYVETFAGR